MRKFQSLYIEADHKVRALEEKLKAIDAEISK